MKRLSAESVYYIRCAVWELNSGLIFTSIWVLYYSVMKLSLFEISVLSIILMLSNLILEVPTGILADVYSRRFSVILGGACIGLAYVLMGAYPIIAIALLGAFIEAVGDTCVSGALQAWITDEVGTDRVGGVFLHGRQVGIPAHWIGVLLSIALAAWFNIQVPIVVGGAMWFALTGFLILFMPETNFQRPGLGSQREQAAPQGPPGVTLKTFIQGIRLVRGSQILLLLFLTQFFGSVFFDSFYKYSRANILLGFSLPVVTLPLLGALKENAWLGGLEMLQGLVCLVGMEAVRRWIPLSRAVMAARALLGLTAFMLVGALVFAWTGSFALAILAWLVVSSLQEISGPIQETWLNQNIPSSIRSTVLSMNSQVGILGQMAGSASLGLYGDRFGVRSALRLAGVFLAPLLAVYGRQDAVHLFGIVGKAKKESLS